jgi:hypothetical protein
MNIDKILEVILYMVPALLTGAIAYSFKKTTQSSGFFIYRFKEKCALNSLLTFCSKYCTLNQ